MHKQLTPGAHTIWKLPIDIADEPQILRAPGLKKVLHFGEQSGQLYVWCEVVIDAPEETIGVQVVGTGQEIAPDFIYVGTVQVMLGTLWVWHLYKEPVAG